MGRKCALYGVKCVVRSLDDVMRSGDLTGLSRLSSHAHYVRGIDVWPQQAAGKATCLREPFLLNDHD